MDTTAVLADYLDAQMDAILAVWRSTVERVGDVPEAERLSRTDFLDHIPVILQHLAEQLRGLNREHSTIVASQEHGRHRWLAGYDIAEVVRELGHLRTTLISATLEFCRLNDVASDDLFDLLTVINSVLDVATAESIQQYQEDSRLETSKALAEVEIRQAAMQDAWLAAKLEQAKLRTVLKNLPVGVWVFDGNGTLVAVNSEAERLQGFPSSDAELNRLSLDDLRAHFSYRTLDGNPISGDELPTTRALRGEIVLQQEMLWGTPDALRYIVVGSTPLLSHDGQPTGAVTVVQDVTNSRKLEADLAGSEARFRAIVEQSPVLIWRTDAEGTIDFVNQAWLDFTGRSRDAEMGQGWAEGIHPDDSERALAVIAAAINGRETLRVDYRLRRHDGQFRWISDHGAPFYGADNRFLGYLGSAVDITERIELEVSLAQQRELAEEASRHKTRIVSALSHDARTPLNAVVLAAELLEIQVRDQSDPEVHECLRTIRNSVNNVLDLLGDLLNLSKIDAGALPAMPSRFPVMPVLSECLSSIKPQAKLKGLQVSIDAGPLAELSVETDRSKLKQILSNLLSNALRYTDHGSIEILGHRDAETIEISVRDTGVGIAAEDQARIFDEFTILDAPERSMGERTGLGLAICHRLASLLNGEIRLTSAPGSGSTFRLRLPASILVNAEPVEVAARLTQSHDGEDGGAVLIAEDHLESRQTLARVISRMGYRTLEASNGRDALALARRERPVAILMDVNMPIMDGIDATIALRADPATRDLPIFALTGDVTLVNQHRIGEAGVNGYLEKPVTWDRIQKALATIGKPARP
ncbi:PAS domain S-box protein [Isosphaeraceae bacterium EP7]